MKKGAESEDIETGEKKNGKSREKNFNETKKKKAKKEPREER